MTVGMMQSEIMIAPMRQEHIAQIASLEQICFGDPWPEQSIQSELTNPLSLWLVALDGQTVVGYIGSQAVLGEADIMNVAVAPQYRKQGIGTRLLCNLQERLKQNKVYSLSLEVRASNDTARALYSVLGYKEVGRRPNYYHHPKEDALILRKEWTL